MSKRPEGLVFDVVFIFVSVGLAALASFIFGYTDGFARYRAIQVEAVEHGYAEWVPDNKGKVTFTWKGTQ